MSIKACCRLIPNSRISGEIIKNPHESQVNEIFAIDRSPASYGDKIFPTKRTKRLDLGRPLCSNRQGENLMAR